ncbi:MAG: hypothetical protein K0V04_12120 [Deltaproteobacteria bacterium]|nr:hypothetical protein [Deltaproteobacteria bacterium]
MTPQLWLGGLWAVVVLQRLTELRLAKRNEAWARGRGAVEYGAGHYPVFFVLHTGWLLAWPLEAWLTGPQLATGFIGWLAMFAAAEMLRYWAITSLGRRWNTRILVLQGLPLVRRGPYRVIPHPNYLAVILELAALPLAFGAYWTAAVVGALNLVVLLAIRIPAERRALDAAARATPSS